MFSFLKPIFSFLKKAVLVMVVFFIILALFSYFIRSDKNTLVANNSTVSVLDKNRADIYKVINDPKLNKTKEGKLTISIFRASICGMIGEACTNNPADADKNYGKSVFGFMTNLIVMPYVNPPASGIAWVSNSLQNAGFIPKTYAAEGIGFAAIQPFANLWKIFRDLSYMLLVIILIAIGFMVMFRTKINPQTVISVENALPKIVISLILITFSFAIAGFMIDLMYVLIILIISILSKNTTAHIDVQAYQNALLNGDMKFIFDRLGNIWGIGDALLSFMPTAGIMIFNVITGIILYFVIGMIPGIGPILTGKLAGGAWGKWAEVLLSMVTAIPRVVAALALGVFIVPLIISILVWFTVVFLFFRITFLLFKSYIEIILFIIFAPILLLFEAIPGKNTFSWWFKNLLGNLISFPLVVLFMIIATIIIESSTTGANIWTPPLLPQIGHAEFGTLIGIGIMFLIPDFIKLIKEAIGLKPLPIQVGLGTYFGGTAAAVGGGIGLLGQFGSVSLGLQAFGVDTKAGLVAGIMDKAQGAFHRPNPQNKSITE